MTGIARAVLITLSLLGAVALYVLTTNAGRDLMIDYFTREEGCQPKEALSRYRWAIVQWVLTVECSSLALLLI